MTPVNTPMMTPSVASMIYRKGNVTVDRKDDKDGKAEQVDDEDEGMPRMLDDNITGDEKNDKDDEDKQDEEVDGKCQSITIR